MALPPITGSEFKFLWTEWFQKRGSGIHRISAEPAGTSSLGRLHSLLVGHQPSAPCVDVDTAGCRTAQAQELHSRESAVNFGDVYGTFSVGTEYRSWAALKARLLSFPFQKTRPLKRALEYERPSRKVQTRTATCSPFQCGQPQVPEEQQKHNCHLGKSQPQTFNSWHLGRWDHNPSVPGRHSIQSIASS